MHILSYHIYIYIYIYNRSLWCSHNFPCHPYFLFLFILGFISYIFIISHSNFRHYLNNKKFWFYICKTIFIIILKNPSPNFWELNTRWKHQVSIAPSFSLTPIQSLIYLENPIALVHCKRNASFPLLFEFDFLCLWFFFLCSPLQFLCNMNSKTNKILFESLYIMLQFPYCSNLSTGIIIFFGFILGLWLWVLFGYV